MFLTEIRFREDFDYEHLLHVFNMQENVFTKLYIKFDGDDLIPEWKDQYFLRHPDRYSGLWFNLDQLEFKDKEAEKKLLKLKDVRDILE
jgi:hypothetical protein